MALGHGLVWEQGEGHGSCLRAVLGSDAKQPVAQGCSQLVCSWTALGPQEGSDEHETTMGAEWCDSYSREMGPRSAWSTSQPHVFGMWAPGVPGAGLPRRCGGGEVVPRPAGVLAFSVRAEREVPHVHDGSVGAWVHTGRHCFPPRCRHFVPLLSPSACPVLL